ncbi:hypothetical protein [Hyphomonas sp.]|uniref:hypothetical protein n=1 Tax=Hyphomonas sp. TaxID=87 RepID=UPI003D2C4E8A
MTISIFDRACKLLVTATLGLGIAMSANANAMEETFQVAFEFSRDKPVQETYLDFKDVAADACQPRAWVSMLRAPHAFVRKCEAELMENAVTETRFPALAAYHHLQTGQVDRTRVASQD